MRSRQQSTKERIENRDAHLKEKLDTATRVWIQGYKMFQEGNLSGKDLIGLVESLNQAEWIWQKHAYVEVEMGFPGTEIVVKEVQSPE